MFNLYTTLNKKDEENGTRRRESDVTGHDRFYQERPRSRRKRRPSNRRTKSAIELDTNAILTAQANHARRNRSASIEGGESSSSSIEDRFQLTMKIDSLAKLLFNRVSAAKAYRDNEIRNGRSNYESLDQGSSFREESGEYLEMEKKSRDHALSVCEVYIQGSLRYNLIKQLCNVGSRVDKHWFAVRDTTLKTDRLLTLVPLNRNCPLTVCSSTKDVLNKLFLALQHPYVCPVFDLEFIEFEGQNYVILVQPINQGSMKDLIYGIERNCWNADWSHKYTSRGKGLTLPQILQMGRQVLEALIFLKDRGFPTVTHLHSGNVVIQNGVARLAGLENSLLGFTSRIHPVVTSRPTPRVAVDSICFGHMLFEMCTGYELCAFKPSSVHMADLEKYPKVGDLMDLIFNQPGGHYPSVEELLVHDLFRNIDLREMRNAPMFRPILMPSIVALLETIKRHNNSRRIPSIIPEEMISLQSPEAQPTNTGRFLTEMYNEITSTTL
ncbi:slowpoke-binding protein isoform X2 [Diachasma alloeum]|uniref:slowpoke-binding protein isoform X2 n=1 Tax=Diachasma alloeum TaxID=454923 RepID=UPI0007381F13|nr:slowpoke-binding protein isoform X2 [Diachasma alloeum]